MESKLGPLRSAKGADVSAADMAKMEKEFISLVEQWSSRRRRFNDAFEIILESGGMAKKKFAEDLGVEFDAGDLGEKLAEYKKLVDTVKRKRMLEERQKKFKKNVP